MSSAPSVSFPDAPSQSQKRARAGTATVKDSSNPTLDAPALEETLDGSMSVGFDDTLSQVAIFINEEAVKQDYVWGVDFLEDVLASVSNFLQLKLPMDNLCLARFLHATPDDEMDTIQAVQKCFGSGPLPEQRSYATAPPIGLWIRKGQGEKEAKRAPKLLNGVADNQWRGVKDRSFTMFATPVALWPPPLWLGPGTVESTIWGFDVKKEYDEEVVIGALQDALSRSFVGIFCRVVSHQITSQFMGPNCDAD